MTLKDTAVELFVKRLKDDRTIGSAETKRVTQCNLDVLRLSRMRDIVKIAIITRVIKVNRWRRGIILQLSLIHI